MGRMQIRKLIISRGKKKIFKASCLDVSQRLMNKIGINSNIIVGTHRSLQLLEGNKKKLIIASTWFLHILIGIFLSQ